nr:ATP synthase F0 subunit 6 [Haematoloechus sp. CW13H]
MIKHYLVYCPLFLNTKPYFVFGIVVLTFIFSRVPYCGLDLVILGVFFGVIPLYLNLVYSRARGEGPVCLSTYCLTCEGNEFLRFVSGYFCHENPPFIILIISALLGFFVRLFIYFNTYVTRPFIVFVRPIINVGFLSAVCALYYSSFCFEGPPFLVLMDVVFLLYELGVLFVQILIISVMLSSGIL